MVEEKRKSGYMVTRNAIRLQARMAAIDRLIHDFRGTTSWCSKFMKRKKIGAASTNEDSPEVTRRPR